ncbi:MAG: TlpA family protein disulfide reductase [Candidatus Eremiobacteraeota bacterium]|nr:TlpA family protein disulfide reductase [Candidatus Eremiobacteraeota bacterium]MBC5827694.1 TlpA family protein disulfide reductase [Candidatus Eremiobacteraeota bacterium]
MRRWIIGGLVAAAIVIFVAAFFPTSGNQAAGPAQAVGAKMPDVVFPSLTGGTVDFTSLRGHRVLVNVWATWCGPCRREMPALQRLARVDSGHLDVIAIDQGEGSATVKAFASRFSIAFPIALDQSQRLGTVLHLIGLPSSFFVDKNGVIREAVDGEMDYATMSQKAQSLLAM